MKDRITVDAPAKVNLYLNILSKRADGYHNIETIFEKISLCDRLTLTKRKQGIKVFCRCPGVPQDRSNLAFQAAEVLLKEANSAAGVTIRIKKNIPVAAGLGGGSSDAAAVLLGLNHLLGLKIPGLRLRQMAVDLGADVPFFLLPSCRAIGTGKGEVLTKVTYGKEYWYILVVPRGLMVSTRQMYQTPRITLTKRTPDVKIILHALAKGDLTALDKNSYNSFAAVLQRKYKQIAQVQKALRSSGVQATLVSGSGPCVFGVAQTGKEAGEIKDRLAALKRNWQIIIAKTYTKIPGTN
ncbi:MAG: 4-(cytidine 5'-diphospho)-2-C-methyl-D-erythritol kinase [Candidatus Omnitrophota bacterium]